VYPRGEAPISGVEFACGICRMRSDPTSSVVNGDGRSHEIDNLYIADASVFPTSTAIGPALAVIAASLRLADHLFHDRLASG